MELSDIQKKAVTHKDGACLVLAGPGSGKTLTIVKRIEYLIKQYKVPPEDILVVTFTKAAAREMKERFLSLKNGKKGVTFATFHGVYYGILKWAYRMDAGNILSEEEKRAMICETLAQEKIEAEEEKEFVEGIVNEISLIKNNRLNPKEYECHTCGKENFLKVYTSYERKRKQKRKLDFDDILTTCYELFRTREDVLNLWRKKFRYILVDEFQDINQIQYDTIRLLAAPFNNLFVVGDDDQSIYGFRGARPEIILNFEKDYPGAKKWILDQNFRSTKSIASAAARVIENNENRYQKKIAAPGERGDTVHIQEVRDASEEATFVANRIEKAYESGTPYREMAALFRTNKDAGVLTEVLMERGIPFWMKEFIPNMYEHFTAKDIQSYLRMAIGGRERKDLFSVMNKPLRYLERGCVDGSIFSFEEIRRFYCDKDWMQKRIDQLEWDLKLLQKMTPYAAIRYIRKTVGYDEYLREYAKSRGIKKDELYERLDEVQERSKQFGTIEEWFVHIERYGQEMKEWAKHYQEKEDAVRILTMHGAKGLEFDRVFLMHANEDIIPYKKAEVKAEIEEERRLFYVAMTRAKRNLVVSYVKTKNGKDRYPSRFVEELLLC